MLKLLPRHYGKILYEVTKNAPENKLSEAIQCFLRFISERHVFGKIESILESFVDYAWKQEGGQVIEIVSARTLSKQTIEKVKTQFGKKVDAKITTDEMIIGGVVIKVDNLVLDGSLRTQLTQLREKLLAS